MTTWLKFSGCVALKAVGDDIKHRMNKYLNNYLEQDRRAIKSRYYPMKMFKNFFCALIFCTVFEEVRNFFKVNTRPADKLNSADKRGIILSKFHRFQQLIISA